MYSEWASLQQEIQTDSSHGSVLHKFPEMVGREVAGSIVKTLARNLSMATTSELPSNLYTDKDVEWTMEILCYSLGLPLNDSTTVIECVNVYCEWLSAFTEPKTCVPPPILEDPNHYGQQMLLHLQNLFVARANSTAEHINRQAVHCHRVLRVVQSIANNSTILTKETWDCLLKFLLAVNDSVLAPPASKESLGEQIGDRAISVLFEVLLLACNKSFPSPPMWKTLRDMCAQWRHLETVVLQWHRVNLALLSRVMKFMCSANHPQLQISDDDAALIPEEMPNDCVAQCWFRVLHVLSNPVDLARPTTISNTPKFLHHALTNGIDPEQHPCLSGLPHIFHLSMRSVAVLVDALLGLANRSELDLVPVQQTRPTTTFGQPGSTPPPQRRSKSQSAGKGYRGSNITPTRQNVTTVTPSASPSQLTFDLHSILAPSRPKVNSLLHLFGSWLIEAALVGVKGQGTQPRALSRSRTTSFHLEHNPLTTVSGSSVSRHSTHLPDEASLSSLHDTKGQNEVGRAEACGILCRIFSSKRTKEEILPVYLSRFYFVLFHGLDVDKNQSGHVLTSIICNSCDLLRLDLDGVMMLLPRFLRVLEFILPDLTPKFKHDEHVSVVDLRKAAIHLLLAMLCLPLHFKSLTIRSLFGEKPGEPAVTFISLKMRIIELLLRAITVEIDPGNTQMLLGGLMLSVQDMAQCEEAEQTMQQEEIDGQGAPATLAADTAGSSPRDNNTSSQMNGDPTPLSSPRVSKEFDSAQGLFCHAASIVSNRLLASWKLDLNIALAAIEVLSGLAKVRLNRANFLMGKRTVNWICEFILYQCSRPAPSHSKDLHSMIVAAFHCLSLWLVDHSYLLQDKECLQGVLEVLELGISGAKSQPVDEARRGVMEQPVSSPRSPLLRRHSPTLSRKHSKQDKDSHRPHSERVELNFRLDYPDWGGSTQNRASDVPKLKGEKELKPVSLRVKDAAEGLLTVIMDHVGSFPPPCGPESLCSLLDEESLLRYCKDGEPPEQGMPFRYFVIDGTTVIGLYEQPLGNNQDPLPTVTALIRGPFGRHAWTMQLRHQPRYSKTPSKAHLSDPTRPTPQENLGKAHDIHHRYFPDEAAQVALVQADKSIPKLESTMLDQAADLDKMKSIIRNQVTFENSVKTRVQENRAKTPFPNEETECKQPSERHELQTARLFLSHYGFLTLDALKSPANSSRPPALVMLKSGSTGLIQDLEALDSVPCRTSDTVHIFYVRPGQTNATEIMENVTRKRNVQPAFLEFLRSLGWPVDIKRHAGWTGHVATSWKLQGLDSEEEEAYPADTGGSLYDGQQQVLYWADVSTEIAFVVPSLTTYQGTNRSAQQEEKSPKLQHSVSTASSISQSSEVFVSSSSSQSPRLGDPRHKAKSLSLDLDGHPDRVPTQKTMTPLEGTGRRFGRASTHLTVAETKVFVVWLESYEDCHQFPSGDLLAVTSSGLEASSVYASVASSRQVEPPLYIIYIHALQNGLYRIHMQGQVGKMALAVPLADGMIASRRTLGALVRQTAINICRRKRLESDIYQPPHVRRKIKIKEMVDKYRDDMTEAEFYTALFRSSSS